MEIAEWWLIVTARHCVNRLHEPDYNALRSPPKIEKACKKNPCKILCTYSRHPRFSHTEGNHFGQHPLTCLEGNMEDRRQTSSSLGTNLGDLQIRSFILYLHLPRSLGQAQLEIEKGKVTHK